MPTYITLMQFSQKGIEKIKESPSRLEKAKKAIKAAGGEMKAFYLTTGHYDGVVISEAPNDQAYATAILAIASGGSIRTQTLHAFTEQQYRKIIGDLP